MKIGLLKEIKSTEKRVLLTPDGISELIESGHEIFVENGAGDGSHFSDLEYESKGATILPTSEKIFREVDIILKVQPPLPVEYELYSENHLNISFLHLPGNTDRAQALLKQESIFFALESFRDSQNKYPVLVAMNEISANLAIIHAATLLQSQEDGKAILLPATTYSEGATVTILGVGTAGITAASKALQSGAKVNVVDKDFEKLQIFKNNYHADTLNVYEFSRGILRELLIDSDVLIGAAFRLGEKPDLLVREDDVRLMKKGSVVIDLTIEHGGCIETARQSSFEEPVYKFEGILHSCILNLPSAVSHTSSLALSHSALSFISSIANLGIQDSVLSLPEIRSGLKLYHGKVIDQKLAGILNKQLYDIIELFELNL